MRAKRSPFGCCARAGAWTFLLFAGASAAGDDAQQALLRQDPRLVKGITADLRSPTFQDLLSLLHQHTDVPLVVDQPLAGSRASFALAIRGTPAWVVMDQVVQSMLIDGRWEATATGYRLLGTPKAPQPAPPPAAKPSVFTSPFFLVNAIALATIMAARIVRCRKRARQPPDNSLPSSQGPEAHPEVSGSGMHHEP